MDIEATLARIGYSGPRDVSLDTLRALMQAFLHAVPFENLDIHIERPIAIDPQAVFAKIVGERRGGFCYECNGLFRDLLVALGYEVEFLSARMTVHGAIGCEYDHMALLVNLDGPVLADVGNGQSCREPLRLEERAVVTNEGIDFQLAPHGDGMALYWREPGRDWSPRFLLDTRAQPREAFAEMAEWHQRSPDSPFTQRRVTSLATPEGRVTLTAEDLIETRGRERRRSPVACEAAYLACLRERFGIELPAGARLRAHAAQVPA